MKTEKNNINGKNIVPNSTPSSNKYVWLGVILGFVFPILAWMIEILRDESLSFSIIDIWKMHTQNPLHFIIDSAPLILGLVSAKLSKAIGRERVQLLEQIKMRERIIEMNVDFASRIGRGDFAELENETIPGDNLGHALSIMRDNLVATYEKENELNWIAKGKEIVRDILSQHTNIDLLAYETIVSLINYIDAVQGAFYIYEDEKDVLRNIATYAYNRKKYINKEFKKGQGLIGQVAFEGEYIYRKEIPNDYVTISSGILGDKKPKTILVAPLISDDKLQGVIEFASLQEDLQPKAIALIKELSEIIAQTLFNLKVATRTEKLLEESNRLTTTLEKNKDELLRNAEEMKRTQIQLEKSNKELEAQFEEVEKGQKRQYALLENASEVITIYDQNGIVKYVSPSVKNILGFEAEEMVGTNRFERGEPILQIAFDELKRDPSKTKTFEYRYENKQKQKLWLETTGRNLTDNPAIQGILFNTRDITVRKVAEKAQRMSGEMQALSENSPDMIMRLATDGTFFYANPMVDLFLGVSSKLIIKKTLAESSINQDIKEIVFDILKTVINSGKKIEIETVFNAKTENERIVQINAIPEFSKEKELETVLMVAHDITERKKIELEIEHKNKSITESINYAKRIQTAILPDTLFIKRFLPKSFIFYKPRDVVSGDFPWFFEKDEIVYIAAVDCTGHGVPGALLSFIGYFILNNVVDHDKDYTASEILDILHANVRTTLKQDSPDADARDGMDIALCKINKKTKTLEFSGAHRPLYFLSGSELKEYKGTPKAIGGIPLRKKQENNFLNHVINFEDGEKIFFFSDGLPDQLGGDDKRKYQAKRIREVITENYSSNMPQFRDVFEKDLKEWMGKEKQIDDILLIGVEF